MRSTTTPATSAECEDKRRFFRRLIRMGRKIYKKMPRQPSTEEELMEWVNAMDPVIDKLQAVILDLPDKARLESRIEEMNGWEEHILSIHWDISSEELVVESDSGDDMSSTASTGRPSDREVSEEEADEETSQGRSKISTACIRDFSPSRAGQKRYFIAEDTKANGKGTEEETITAGVAKKIKTAAAASSGVEAQMARSPQEIIKIDNDSATDDTTEVRRILALRERATRAEEAFDRAMLRLESVTHDFLVKKRQYAQTAAECACAIGAFMERRGLNRF
ncbi:hypothetical protein BD410DRAFT_810160 [Rickenella mellea]|uniref:Uncharacterized protein n=1 Tax=Rickenella mellea TaxID=50990 RepID=A0A4Y7PHM5_9AGAM|nr:hypothetical protein BD410DRAFT_810160 [Rickenella mellea]